MRAGYAKTSKVHGVYDNRIFDHNIIQSFPFSFSEEPEYVHHKSLRAHVVHHMNEDSKGCVWDVCHSHGTIGEVEGVDINETNPQKIGVEDKTENSQKIGVEEKNENPQKIGVEEKIKILRKLGWKKIVMKIQSLTLRKLCGKIS
eukprot:UN21511